MASFEKRGKRWRVQFMRQRKRVSRTFATKQEAIAWAAEAAQASPLGCPYGATVSDLLDRYSREESPKKRGKKWEQLRLANIGKSGLGAVRLDALKTQDFAKWRDGRLKEVSQGSVRREWVLVASAFNLAVREWNWLPANPMKAIKAPQDPPPRTRRVTDKELTALYHACGYSPDEPPVTIQSRVGAAIRLAVASAMRAGEMVNLHWKDVDGKVAAVSGKTGPRKVPLTPDALAVLKQLHKVTKGGSVLGMNGAQLDGLFRRARDRVGLADLHFHDTRAEALTRLARKVDVLTLARISGHKDLRLLQSTYFRETVEDIADRLG